MTLLEELYEKTDREGPNGLFPGAELVEIAEGTHIIQAIKVRTKFFTREERVRLKQNFEVLIEGNEGRYAHIIERQKKWGKQENQPRNFLVGLIRII